MRHISFFLVAIWLLSAGAYAQEANVTNTATVNQTRKVPILNPPDEATPVAPPGFAAIAGSAPLKKETPPAPAAEKPASVPQAAMAEYTVGIDDVLEISMLEPEKMASLATVSPDGTISFAYIGNVNVRGMTLNQIQEMIRTKLSEGYLKYPVVSVSLRESRSRKFFVYGEVIKPGAYFIEENTTVLKAISMAGGFTRYGSSSRVKILRSRKGGPGYEQIKINIKAVMDGDSNADIVLQPGDTVVVSEGVF